MLRREQHVQKKGMTEKLELFKESSCVVFVSLAEKFAAVVKGTKSMQKVLGYSLDDICG
jgi:hypothetical protein